MSGFPAPTCGWPFSPPSLSVCGDRSPPLWTGAPKTCISGELSETFFWGHVSFELSLFHYSPTFHRFSVLNCVCHTECCNSSLVGCLVSAAWYPCDIGKLRHVTSTLGKSDSVSGLPGYLILKGAGFSRSSFCLPSGVLSRRGIKVAVRKKLFRT
jgi:hypothetical protein